MNNNTADIRQSSSTNISSLTSYSEITDSEDDGLEQSRFFSRLAMCATVAEFQGKILSIISNLGFTDFTFNALDAPVAKKLTTLPDEIQHFYLQNDFANYDFLMEHAAGSDSPLYVSSLNSYVRESPFVSERIQKNLHYYKLLENLGYYDCYSIPHSFGRKPEKSIFIVFAKDLSREEFCRKVEQNKSLLSMIVGAVVYFGFTHFPEYFLGAKLNGQLLLTPKPLKMLETVAKDGLLLKDAAKKNKISLDTANKHVAAVKQALGATTLANAVYLAMTHGLLTSENSDERKG